MICVAGFYDKPTMTVAELISELQQLPQDAPVITEGCDCLGVAGSVEIEHDGIVIIHRYTDPDELYRRPR